MAKVIVANTELERHAIYRFRYQVYVEELQKQPRTADHQAKTLSDELDETATLLYMVQDDQIIATLRRNRLDLGLPDQLESLLALKQFTAAFPPSSLSLSSRLMVAPAWRNSLAAGTLILEAYRMAREQGIQFDFLYTAPWLLPVYRGLGYRCYAPHFLDADVGLQIPQVLLLEDLDHLQALRSPMQRLARRYGGSSQTRDWFTQQQFAQQRFAQLADPAAIPGLDLSAEGLAHLMQVASVYSLAAGEAIVRLGDVTNAMFLILSGEVEVNYLTALRPPGNSSTASIRGPGQTFSETNLFHSSPSLEQATALTQTDLLILPQPALPKLMKSIPATMCHILLNASRSICNSYIPPNSIPGIPNVA